MRTLLSARSKFVAHALWRAASTLVSRLGAERRDESRRCRHECLRHEVALLLLLAIPCLAQVQQNTLPPQLRDVGIDQRLEEQLPLDLVFRDEGGKSVELRQYFGRKPVILALVYYECPMLCNLVLNGLLRALRTISFSAGREFEVVAVSINPRETPALAEAKKRKYVGGYGRPDAYDGFHFLTGDEPSIRRVADAVGFRYKYDPSTEEYAHASGIMVLTPQGKLARYFYGVEYSARDLRLGLVEASAEKIGSPVDQILLFCFHYDPQTGKYGAVIMKAVRAAGLATLLALGSFVFVMLRRDRRQGHVV